MSQYIRSCEVYSPRGQAKLFVPPGLVNNLLAESVREKADELFVAAFGKPCARIDSPNFPQKTWTFFLPSDGTAEQLEAFINGLYDNQKPA